MFMAITRNKGKAKVGQNRSEHGMVEGTRDLHDDDHIDSRSITTHHPKQTHERQYEADASMQPRGDGPISPIEDREARVNAKL